MAEDFYASLAADYDRMIRWGRRLEAERPAFESLWKRFSTRSVLDASCGTGHHLVLFYSMGLRVHGSDASPQMIKLARQALASAQIPPENVALTVSLWSELERNIPHTFDGVLCVGNSLPYVPRGEALEASLKGLWSRVNPNGFLLIQFKNFAKLQKQQQRFLPLSWSAPPNETVAVRMYDYHPDRIDFNVILLDKQGEQWSMRHHVTPLTPYTPQEIQALLEPLGARVTLHGSLALEPYDADTSEDSVILAIKAS